MYTSYAIEYPFTLSVLHTMFVRHYPEGFHFAGEFHDFWECVCVLEGEVCVSGDKNVYLLREGDIVFHKPMEIHKFHVDRKDGCRLLIFSFRMTGEGCAFFEDLVTTMNDEERATVDALLAYLRRHVGKGDVPEAVLPAEGRPTPDVAMLATFLTRLLLLLRQHSERAVPSYTSEAALFSEAAGYLESHVQESIRSEELAHRLGISLSGLKRLFRRYADMGVHEYFLHLKLRYAITLLADGYRVSEVAAQLGFSSQAHFSRAFIRAMGYPPSVIRRLT